MTSDLRVRPVQYKANTPSPQAGEEEEEEEKSFKQWFLLPLSFLLNRKKCLDHKKKSDHAFNFLPVNISHVSLAIFICSIIFLLSFNHFVSHNVKRDKMQI